MCFTLRDPKPLEEIGGTKFENKLVVDTLETLFPGLEKEQFSYVVIRHYNPDGSYEINVYVVSMVNGRQYTPYFDARDIHAMTSLNRKLHQENPLLTDPNAPELARVFKDNPNWNVSKKDFFAGVMKIIESKYNLDLSEKLPTKEQVENLLKENGYDIEYRTSKNKEKSGIYPYVIKDNREILLRSQIFQKI